MTPQNPRQNQAGEKNVNSPGRGIITTFLFLNGTLAMKRKWNSNLGGIPERISAIALILIKAPPGANNKHRRVFL